jgi:hypothetical protein
VSNAHDLLDQRVLEGVRKRRCGTAGDAEQDGYSFECIGKRDRCKVFRLCGEPDIEGSGGGGSGRGSTSLTPSDLLAPTAALDAGVERAAGSPPRLEGKGDKACAPRPDDRSLSTGPDRLFDMEPERTHHYEEDMAA